MRQESIGIVGLGRMGLPIARHLATAGHRVWGFDVRTEARDAAAARGIKPVSSAASLAAHCDASIVVVGHDDEVRDVVAGKDGILAASRPGHTILISSTVRPETSAALLHEAAARDAFLLDATLALGEPAAEAATLLIFGAGEEQVFERWRPTLSAFATRVVHLGPVPNGQIAKIINNLIMRSAIVATFEGLRLGQAAGLRVDQLRDALMASSANTWVLETWDRDRPMAVADGVVRKANEYLSRAGLDAPVSRATLAGIGGLIAETADWRGGSGYVNLLDYMRASHPGASLTWDESGSGDGITETG